MFWPLRLTAARLRPFDATAVAKLAITASIALLAAIQRFQFQSKHLQISALRAAAMSEVEAWDT